MEEFYKKETEKLERDRREVVYKYLEFGLEFYKRELDFNYQFVIYLGLIAGFGFTAIQKVQSNALFVLAELILLLTAAYVLFYTKKITAAERSNLIGDSQKCRLDFYKQWDELLGVAKKENYTEVAYKRHLNTLAAPVFGPKTIDGKNINVLPGYAIASCFIGASLLLLSFFWPSFVTIISCLRV